MSPLKFLGLEAGTHKGEKVKTRAAEGYRSDLGSPTRHGDWKIAKLRDGREPGLCNLTVEFF